MITEKDLQEAIAECEGQRNPNANTCIKLAAFYIIKKELFGVNNFEQPVINYSYAADNNINYESDSEFSKIIKNKKIDDVLLVVDELMDTLSVINPRLYNGVINKLSY